MSPSLTHADRRVVYVLVPCARLVVPVCPLCRYDWDSTLPGAAAVLASMPTLSVSTAARDWLETFVLAKWEVRGMKLCYATAVQQKQGVYPRRMANHTQHSFRPSTHLAM